MKRQLLVNAIITPDGTRLESRHRYDFVGYTDKSNGKFYAVDGGIEYARTVLDGPFIDARVYADDLHTKIRQEFRWKTYGINREYAPDGKFVKMCDMTTDHIENILATQFDVTLTDAARSVKNAFVNELKYRQIN